LRDPGRPQHSEDGQEFRLIRKRGSTFPKKVATECNVDRELGKTPVVGLSHWSTHVFLPVPNIVGPVRRCLLGRFVQKV